MKDMTREESRAYANEMQGSRDAQKNLGRKPVRKSITVTVKRGKRSPKR